MDTNSLPAGLVYMVASLKRLLVREALTAFRTQTLLPGSIDQAAEQFRNTLRQDILYALNGRFERGVALAKQGAVSAHHDPNQPGGHRQYRVASANQSHPPYSYLVDLEVNTCECPDFWKGHFCKHRIAAHIFEIRQTVAPIQSQAVASAHSATGNVVQPAAPVPHVDIGFGFSEPDADTGALPSKESIIWGVIKHGGQWLGVEILSMSDDKATIRALPKITEGKKLQPQFPFEGKRATTTILKKHIFHVKIFQ